MQGPTEEHLIVRWTPCLTILIIIIIIIIIIIAKYEIANHKGEKNDTVLTHMIDFLHTS